MNYARIIDAEKMLIYFFKTKLVNLYFLSGGTSHESEKRTIFLSKILKKKSSFNSIL